MTNAKGQTSESIEASPRSSFLDACIKCLKTCKAEENVASIYWDDEPDHFSSGFVCEVADGFVLMAHFTALGKYDGFRSRSLEGVCKVKWGGKYENKLQTLYKLQHQSHPSIPTTGSLIKSLLLYAKANSLYISAELLNSEFDDIKGQVLDVDGDTLKIHVIDEYGDDDGTCIIHLGDIAMLVCDSQKVVTRKLLAENRGC